ncbi:MAG: hypothetical protein SO119_06405 [Phascolarctobacterium sp.]|nr:hypothetical protein [Phascolarctobacterium sp.]
MSKLTHDSLWGAGAAGSVLSGNLLSTTQLVTALPFANTAQQVLPGCTGVCGACAGSCVSSVAVTAFLGLCVWKNKSKA